MEEQESKKNKMKNSERWFPSANTQKNGGGSNASRGQRENSPGPAVGQQRKSEKGSNPELRRG